MLEGRPVFLTWWVAKVIYTVFKEYDCYRVVYDPISQRDIGDCAIIKTFYSRPIFVAKKHFQKSEKCMHVMSLKVSTRHKGGDFYLQISVSWQVFKTRCLSSRNQFLLDILQWQILLSISLKHIRKLLLNYLLELVKATSGQRMTRETSWYTPATSALPEGHLSGDLWGTST